jgi:hypothetical protein
MFMRFYGDGRVDVAMVTEGPAPPAIEIRPSMAN